MRIRVFLIIFLLLFAVPIFAEAPLWKGSGQKKIVALTFDDGPHAKETLQVLDILDRYGVRATFFLVGKSVKKYPDLTFRIATTGHEIGNHSYTHTSLNKENAREELLKTNEIIKEITGQDLVFLRAPGGSYSSRVREIGTQLGLRMVNWSLNADDYVKTSSFFQLAEEDNLLAEKIKLKILKEVSAGSIILFHQSQATIQALPFIIEGLLQKGYHLGTVSDLLREDRRQ